MAGEGRRQKVTFVITHHNRPLQLKAAVASVCRQTRPPDEIVIVDDASIPDARRAIGELASVATLHYSTRNLGPSAARNVGLESAAGEWVAFVDDDDECLPDRLERQLGYVSAHPDCEFVGGAVWRVTPEGKRDYWGERETGRKTTREILARTAAMAPTILARKATLIRVGGFRSDLRGMEDFELGIRLAASGVALHYLAEPLILYRQGHDQGSARWFRMLTSHLAVVVSHRASYAREFGPLGALQMFARVCRKRGISRGGLPGRAVWGLGHLLFLAAGDPMGPLD